MVKYWRQNSINIVLYLDDGFGMCNSLHEFQNHSSFVKHSFLINEEKSIFRPSKSLEWLGIVWNSDSFSLSIPDRRVIDLLQSIDQIITCFPKFTARQLAQVTGKIISLSPVLGHLTRLMTRYCYICIESRVSWDKLFTLAYPDQVLTELKFWRQNVEKLNCKRLKSYSPSSVIVYSDASNVAGAAYTVELENKVCHKMWNEIEKKQSSTWREMRAIEQALLSFKDVFQGKNLKWYTDNQNCVRIIQSGSMKEPLQILAFSICNQNGISLETQWIPRAENSKADYFSKMIDHEDWGVSDELFYFIDSLWGHHTIDRFASPLNNKTSRFNSLFWCPNSEAVDAFTQNWSKENNWLVPPIFLVVRAIKHLVFHKAVGTLIVPRWDSSHFWPCIFYADLKYEDYVKDVLDFSVWENL